MMTSEYVTIAVDKAKYNKGCTQKVSLIGGFSSLGSTISFAIYTFHRLPEGS